MKVKKNNEGTKSEARDNGRNMGTIRTPEGRTVTQDVLWEFQLKIFVFNPVKKLI